LIRALRRAGAQPWLVWERGSQVRGLCPDSEDSRRAIAELAPSGAAPTTLESFVARDPRIRWAASPLVRLHPCLNLAEAWSGVAAG
jgi:hypothetical protein